MKQESLSKLISELQGKRCWRVTSAYGSMVDIDIGGSYVQGLGAGCESFLFGEFTLFIGSAQWRLSSGSVVVASSLDDLTEAGYGHKNLKSIEGQKIQRFELINEYFDFILTFENRLELALFCNACVEGASNYSVSIRGTYYIVECRNRVMTVRIEADHHEKREKGQ